MNGRNKKLLNSNALDFSRKKITPPIPYSYKFMKG